MQEVLYNQFGLNQRESENALYLFSDLCGNVG